MTFEQKLCWLWFFWMKGCKLLHVLTFLFKFASYDIHKYIVGIIIFLLLFVTIFEQWFWRLLFVAFSFCYRMPWFWTKIFKVHIFDFHFFCKCSTCWTKVWLKYNIQMKVFSFQFTVLYLFIYFFLVFFYKFVFMSSQKSNGINKYHPPFHDQHYFNV